MSWSKTGLKRSSGMICTTKTMSTYQWLNCRPSQVAIRLWCLHSRTIMTRLTCLWLQTAAYKYATLFNKLGIAPRYFIPTSTMTAIRRQRRKGASNSVHKTLSDAASGSVYSHHKWMAHRQEYKCRLKMSPLKLSGRLTFFWWSLTGLSNGINFLTRSGSGNHCYKIAVMICNRNQSNLNHYSEEKLTKD